MSTNILREAEADLAELARLPGAIRDKVKAGVADLKRLHDAIDAEVARLTDGAKATLDALRGPAGPDDAPPPAEDGRQPPSV